MEVVKNINGTELKVSVSGRVDTTTAPQLDAEVKASIEGMTVLEFDMSGLEYISSAGLRVLLASQKTMNKQGSMVVKNVSEDIMEIFEVTGFDSILDIQ